MVEPETTGDSSSEERVSFRLVEHSNQSFARDPYYGRDLDSVWPEFTNGKPIAWGGVIAVAPPGPSADQRLEGPGWLLHLQLEPYEFKERGRDGQEEEHVVPGPVAIVSVQTNSISLNGARDIGRSLLRSLLGYLAARSNIFVGGTIEWEGAVLPVEDNKIRTLSLRARASVALDDRRLEELRRSLVAFNLAKLKASQRLALTWVAEAWSAPNRSIQLADLWFAVVVVVDSLYSRKQRRKTKQMFRVKAHLSLLPISEARRTDLYSRLKRAYTLRNKVVHEGAQDLVSIEDVEKLWAAVQELLLADIFRS